MHRYIQLRPDSIETAHSHGMGLVTKQIDKKLKRHESQRIVGKKFLESYPHAKDLLANIKAN